MAAILRILSSEQFSAFATVAGLIGDAAVLVLTIYTLHITAFAKKLVFVSPSFSASAFHGNKIGLTLMNKALHALPIQSIFVMKRINKKWYHLSVVDLKEPVAIDSWNVKKFESEPFTKIENVSDDETFDWHEIIQNAVLGVHVGSHILWVKPYKKAPLAAGKRAFKKRNYQVVTKWTTHVDGVVISDTVDLIIRILMLDINGNKSIKTILGKTGFDGGKEVLLSDPIEGNNAIGIQGDQTPERIRQTLIDTFGIDANNISVEKIGGMFVETADS